MKKAKIIALLSVSMILAACGKGNNSSANVPTSTTIESSEALSSLTSGSESQSSSEAIVNPTSMSEEEAYKILDDNIVNLAKFRHRSIMKEQSFTEINSNYYSSYRNGASYAPGAKDPWFTQRERTSDTSWCTMSYDAVNKVGYSLEEEDNAGYREFEQIDWVTKEDGQYKSYDSYNEDKYNVDDAYAWNNLFGNSIIEEIEYFAEEGALKNQVSFMFNSFLDYQDSSLSGYNYHGSLKFETTYSASLTKDGSNDKLSFYAKCEAKYDALKELPEELLGAALLDNQSYSEIGLEFVYNKDSIVSVEIKYNDCYYEDFLTPGGRVVQIEGSESLSKSLITNKYTEYKEYPDTSEYVDQGNPYSRIYIVLQGYGTIGGYTNKMGVDCTIDDSYILSSYQLANGVTYELYEDPECTKKVDKSNIKFKSYTFYLYVKYTVPADITLAFYVENFIWAENYGSRIPSFHETDVYEDAPINGFRPSYEIINNQYNPIIDATVPTAVFAPTSLKVIYSTDETPTISGTKIDLKGGNYYVLSYDYDQIA
ncbi:MAG: hypothetical protein MJ238_02280 [Bacilli bacterium]|nr:hypothetical protein [Bacilli bacterium]